VVDRAEKRLWPVRTCSTLKTTGTSVDHRANPPDEDPHETMTSQRAQAYATALKSFRDLKPSKFTDAQMDLFQQTTDALFFAETLDEDTADLMATTHAELDLIVEADRLLPETVLRLKDELDAVGPAPVVA
jgi:hypothetical protein